MTPDRGGAAPQLDGLRVCAAQRPAVADRPPGGRTAALRRPRPGCSTATARAQTSLALRDHVALPPGHNPRTLAMGRGAAPPARAGRRPTRARWSRPLLEHMRARRLHLHAGARQLRHATRSTSSGSTASWASASTSPPHCGGDARDGRAGARRHRLPGHRPERRSTATTSCARATPTPGPNTGSPATAGCASTRPPRWRPSASCAAAAWRRRPGLVAGALGSVSPQLLARAAQRAGKRSTTAGTSGC